MGSKTIFYIDMDGVLAKWNEHASEEETHEKGYFLNREVELSALSLIRMLKDSGEEVKILSSVYQDNHSINEKTEWLKRNGLGDIDKIFVPYGESKKNYVKPGNNILIDDDSRNLKQWEEEGYTAIKFMNGINNRPKLAILGDTVTIKVDSWDGYSIDYRMAPKQMFTVVTAVANEIEN